MLRDKKSGRDLRIGGMTKHPREEGKWEVPGRAKRQTVCRKLLDALPRYERKAVRLPVFFHSLDLSQGQPLLPFVKFCIQKE